MKTNVEGMVEINHCVILYHILSPPPELIPIVIGSWFPTNYIVIDNIVYVWKLIRTSMAFTTCLKRGY